MYIKSFFLCCLIGLSVQSIQAQTCNQVLLSGKIYDENMNSSQAFYNVMIVNRTTGRGVFGLPDGKINTYVNDKDSITISVKGYQNFGFRVVADSNCQHILAVKLEPIYKELAEYVVRPLKTLQQIKEERANLSMRETRTVTGINVIESPITALYQRFSKKEQAKRFVAEMQYKDNQRLVLKELLRLYVAYEIFDLGEEEFDDFIAFLNIDEDFLKTSSDLELITFIKDKFDHFMYLKRK